ncbi:MAG: tRNA glutamyl-Q(34) synthetase GluQRS [Sandaracinaceae bacterium]
MSVTAYRGRFAPSPTGPIHLGTARSALLGWLRARKEAGVFILRIEDLDTARVKPGAADAMLADLRWLGLDWDEGPDVGGAFGPYVQSARLERYAEVLAQLDAAGHVYPCTCSRKEIQAIASAPHGDEGPVYPGTCRDRPSHPGRPPATRFRMPDPPPSFVDRLAGPSPENAGRGDFVVHRKDGAFAYQLACVVDDHDEGITEVVRGDDLIPSTPRQIALYEALGWRPPEFVHLPLVRGPDGERIAKRHGAISVRQLRDEGASAEGLIGRLAHSAGLTDRNAPVSAPALIDGFALDRIRT